MLTVGGALRSYLLSVPASARGRPPLVVDLHGYGQSAQQQDSYTGLGAAGPAVGVVVVTPEGVRGQWNFPRRAAVGPDDVAFLAAVLADATRASCSDPGRVVLTGISDGADMAQTAGCALPGIAAVVAVAPSVPVEPCPHAVPTLVEVHGRADPVVPYDGGGGDRLPPLQGTEAVAVARRLTLEAAQRGCASPRPARVTAAVAQTMWACASGRRLAIYTVEGGGHTWPGAAALPALGPTTQQVDATTGVLRVALDPARLPF